MRFAKVNVDENQHIARQFRVKKIPHFIIFKEGRLVNRFVGAIPQSKMEKKIKKSLKA